VGLRAAGATRGNQRLSANLRELHPSLYPAAAYLYGIARSYGAHITSVYRTRQEQTQLYAACGDGRCLYPVAPPGHSRHEQRRAFDLVAHPLILRGLGRLWESMGGTWGGRFGDPIHFEA